MFGQKQVQLACWMLVKVFSFGSFAFAINKLCTEEGNNKISATYNKTVYDRRGTTGICIYGVTGHPPQLQREVVGCLYKTSPDPVCAGNNNTTPCTAVGATEIVNGTTQKTYFVTTGWGYTMYVVAFKFQGEGHFYPVEDICWHIWNTSKVQVSNSSVTLPVTTPSKSVPTEVSNSSVTLPVTTPSKSVPTEVSNSSVTLPVTTPSKSVPTEVSNSSVTLPVTTPSKSVPTEADNSSEVLLVSSTVSSSAHTEGEGSLTSGESNSIPLTIGLSIAAGMVLVAALFCWMYKARAGCFKSCDGQQQMPVAELSQISTTNMQ